ncbi:MAG TPA: methyl-accepting chemotaxis protein [Burkholderiaceae bacterium]|nr:methyl-accepting chemotaxis protein [Burkholderiaceae bacterium]
MALKLGGLFGGKKAQAEYADEQLKDAPDGDAGAAALGAPTVMQLPAEVPNDPEFQPEDTQTMRAAADERLAFKLPLIGHLPIARQIRILTGVLVGALVIGILTVLVDGAFANNNAGHIQMTVDAQVQSQRLAKAVKGAVVGNAASFTEVQEARDQLKSALAVLTNGGDFKGNNYASTPGSVAATLAKVNEDWKRSEEGATTILGQKEPLSNFGNFLRVINESNPQLLELTEQISALKLSSGASAREISASGQLVMLTQRLAKNANELVSGETVNPETAFLLGKDTNTFRDLLDGLLSGSDVLRLPAAPNGSEVQQRLTELKKAFEQFQGSVGGILSNLQRIVQAKQAESLVFRESETLRKDLVTLEEELRGASNRRLLHYTIMLISALLVLGAAAGIAKLFLDDSRERATEAERQRVAAEEQEQEAKRLNDQNQAAILRLMNELQEVADGDLTIQATVSEDITGAIADSVNYTVEELRGLVGRVSSAAQLVADASGQARETSMQLLQASEEQAREIRSTGDDVLRMTTDIQAVSRRASDTADVARRSLSAAEDGQKAVENSITGMNEIRDQIQETAKRIKRLGESSQEIGEIVELISDITEQTNVLALNAAIQAASAGEAGRGFSVVAEEVQRLAERSAEATKQIAALVRTIQTDTQDAVAAMEKSTQGVVEGAKLSDAAGHALQDIGQVSKELAELITDISRSTEQQAVQAAGVSQSITKILAVTEQTSKGTQQTAGSIGQLSELALQLKNSVSRFKTTA